MDVRLVFAGIVVASISLVGCGGGGTSGTGYTPPPANPVLSSIAVTPANSDMTVGSTQQLKATGTLSDGSTQDLTATAQWASGTSDIVSVASSGIATSVAVGQATITANSGSVSGSVTIHAVGVKDVWNPTGKLTQALDVTNLVVLANGKVLAEHDVTGPSGQVTFETYDPAMGTWSAAGTYPSGERGGGHSLTLLPDGKLLYAGGQTSLTLCVSTAVLYDPVTQAITLTGSMVGAHSHHSATLLHDGTVLVAGGCQGIASEVYDPTPGTWSTVGNMLHVRGAGFLATLLNDGRVLVTGGSVPEAEIYDPVNKTWSAAGTMSTPRVAHSATLLPDGRVLVAGGEVGGTRLATSEIYDPTANTWTSSAPMADARSFFGATLFSGKVLVAGGATAPGGLLAKAELFDPASGTWSAIASLGTARENAPAVTLPSGAVLVIGGETSHGPTDSVEIYQ